MKDKIKETNDMWVKINDNDIKEVLDYYKKDIEDYEKWSLDHGISNKEAYQRYKNHKLLLYHIANLQEENERLKENAIHNDKVVDKAKWNEMIYKSRNEKATKYIDDWLFEAGGDGACMDHEDIVEIKHILNGGDE